MNILSKYLHILLPSITIILSLLYILWYVYSLHEKKVELITLQINSMVYEFYLNIEAGNIIHYDDNISDSKLINEHYIVKENKITHVIHNTNVIVQDVDECPIDIDKNKLHLISTIPYYEYYIDSKSVLYDKDRNTYSIINFNIPGEYQGLQFKMLIITIIIIISIISFILFSYKLYHVNVIQDRVSETVNLFKDTSFIVSNFNHEINTPLTSIEASLYTLGTLVKDDSTCPMIKHHCKPINEMNEELSSITDDISFIKQFISKISTLKLINGANQESNNFYEVLEIIKTTVSNITTTKMSVNIDDKFKEIQVILPSEYLYSIFINLLKNSYEADATFVNIYSIEYRYNKICLMYRDNGNGISMNPPEDVFNKFSSSKAKTGIRGFGMYFIKSILKSNNGDISILKTDKYGTEFKIQIPFSEVGSSYK